MVDDWLDNDLGSRGYTNCLQAVLPDFRARITLLELTEDGIRATIGRAQGVDASLKFQAAATVGSVDESLEIEGSGDARLAKLTEPWTEFAFFVLDESEREVIDWAQLHSTIVYPQDLVAWSVPEKQLDQLIQDWETQFVEFKESTASADDLIESVVAFSNSNDGSIIIGVAESGTVVGVGNPRKEEEKVRNLVADWCEPVVNPTFVTIPYYGKTVLVVNVARGKQGPYVSRFTGSIFIRRGSHDVPAKTRALIDGLYPQ